MVDIFGRRMRVGGRGGWKMEDNDGGKCMFGKDASEQNRGIFLHYQWELALNCICQALFISLTVPGKNN